MQDKPTETIVLGDYDGHWFYLYRRGSGTCYSDYFSIDDLFRLFFHTHQYDGLFKTILTLHKSQPQCFYSSQHQHFLATSIVSQVAKSFQLLALAELCDLTHDELLYGIADPLLAITNGRSALRLVTPPKKKNSDTPSVDWVPSPASSLTSYLKAWTTTSTPSPTAISATHTCPSPHPPSHPHYLSPTDATQSPSLLDPSWTRLFLPLPAHLLKHTLQVQRQQQAIIECRQRKLVFAQNHKTASHLATQPAYTGHKRSYAAINNATLPHAPLSIPATDSSCKRKRSPLSSPTNSSSSIDSSSTASSSSSSSMAANAFYLDNLDLLATQATKLKGLPLSPPHDHSPPPFSLPPINFHSSTISLPSLRNVLSDI
ncbi:hypothetical protein DM01DRAFT_1339466 [Hesseltinella vesiculosa]|uniref:Uncharacterized protein n=1 Tax=Hesseltinella vesiculosa TaxID=101127 RepID=A0A1X2G782_9FUNG|nr:hypothetical protein DM01DRAFT_1339466 [Hesseltinella vesiculosa]